MNHTSIRHFRVGSMSNRYLSEYWPLDPTQSVWSSGHSLKRKYRHFDETLRWRHNDHAGVSNHQPPGCLLNRLFRRKSKKTSKLRVTGLCAGNSPGTGEFSAQMASYAENVSIWWRHHDLHRRPHPKCQLPIQPAIDETFVKWHLRFSIRWT